MTNTQTSPAPAERMEQIAALTEALAIAQREYESEGTLTEATFAALETHGGFSRDYLEGFMAGSHAANVRVYVAGAHRIAGGPRAYAELVAWGGENCTPDEIDEYNVAVAGCDWETGWAAVRKLQHRRAGSLGGA